MIATADPFATETTRSRKPRAPRKTGDQSPKPPVGRVPKSSDATMGKASFYLPKETLRKLAVSAVIRGVDQSDIVASLLARELSSVTYYDRSTRPAELTLPATEDRPDVAA